MQTPQNENLVVRQHERVKCALGAEACVAADHQSIVALTASVTDGHGTFAASVVDMSKGGVALRSKIFMPKQACLEVRITDASLLGPGQTAVLNCTCRVMRVSMVNRTPTYELGTAFVNMSPADQKIVSALIKRVAEMQAAAAVTPGEAPRA